MTRVEFVTFVALALSACRASDPAPAASTTPSGGESHSAVTEPAITTGEPAPRENGVVEDTRRISEPDSSQDAFARAMLDAHNRVRATVSPAPSTPLPPLVWDESLAALARNWASGCPDGHRPNNDAGENMYWSGGTTATADAAVGSWSREAQYYDYATGVCRRDGRANWAACGHYTQIVWRDTRRIGCGLRTDCPGDFENVVVCNYDPPGNVNVGATRIPAPY